MGVNEWGMPNARKVILSQNYRIAFAKLSSRDYPSMADCSVPYLRSSLHRNDRAGSGARKGWHICAQSIHDSYRLVFFPRRSIATRSCIGRPRAMPKLRSLRALPIGHSCGRNRPLVWRRLLGLCVAGNEPYRLAR
jgi:hypothetical protein